MVRVNVVDQVPYYLTYQLLIEAGLLMCYVWWRVHVCTCSCVLWCTAPLQLSKPDVEKE